MQAIAERTNNSLIKLKGLNIQLVYKIKDSNYKGLKFTSVYTYGTNPINFPRLGWAQFGVVLAFMPTQNVTMTNFCSNQSSVNINTIFMNSSYYSIVPSGGDYSNQLREA